MVVSPGGRKYARSHVMAEVSRENWLGLTGLWKGLFSYPQLLDPTSFVAILIEQGARFSGTTHEPCTRGSNLGGLLYATIEGRREGSAVSFIKTYDGTGGWTHSVAYEGLLNGDGTEIEGRWKTSGWSGKFLMLRPTAKDAGAKEEGAEQRAAEPVGGP
jgi:hypothetical protein